MLDFVLFYWYNLENFKTLKQMKKLAYIACLCIGIAILTSCAAPKKATTGGNETSEEKSPKGKIVPLSTSLIRGLQLSGAEIQQTQFILHGSITVEGLSTANQKSVENGTIILKEKGTHITHIVVNGTLGIWGGGDKSTIAVRFDQNGSNRLYPFAPGKDGIFYFKPGQNLSISFDGQTYNVSPESRDSYLQVRLLNEKDVESVNTQAPGIPIQEGAPENDVSGGSQNDYYSTPSEPKKEQESPPKPKSKFAVPK